MGRMKTKWMDKLAQEECMHEETMAISEFQVMCLYKDCGKVFGVEPDVINDGKFEMEHL